MLYVKNGDCRDSNPEQRFNRASPYQFSHDPRFPGSHLERAPLGAHQDGGGGEGDRGGLLVSEAFIELFVIREEALLQQGGVNGKPLIPVMPFIAMLDNKPLEAPFAGRVWHKTILIGGELRREGRIEGFSLGGKIAWRGCRSNPLLRHRRRENGNWWERGGEFVEKLKLENNRG